MFVAVHNEKHVLGGTEMGEKFLHELGSHVPYSFLGYLSATLSSMYVHTYVYACVYSLCFLSI